MSRVKANSSVNHLHMSNVQYSRTAKTAQLRLRLTSILRKRKDKDYNIKIKTITKLADVTGRRWWIPLDIDYILHQKNLRDNNASIRKTAVHSGILIQRKEQEPQPRLETHKERKLHAILTTEKLREISRRLRSLRPRSKGTGVNRLRIETTDEEKDHITPRYVTLHPEPSRSSSR